MLLTMLVRLPTTHCAFYLSALALWLLAAISCLFVGGCEPHTSDEDLRSISGAEVSRMMSDSKRSPETILIIDPRTPWQYRNKHVQGAVNVQLEEIRTEYGRRPAYEKYKNLVVYGDDPGSPIARAMAKRLISSNYAKVFILEGGILEWVRQGGPTDSVEAQPTSPGTR